ncbi:hypothetical protein JJV70_07770 [Streptomyces sp. JJ66]|uniref:hypothetical protein n=1 Tax=Streptomyces sp. JJ66 TaxID=2803843 RepID=UPI001C5A3110|nr:hypothetical protein [Streptomyces sp. JJ66]MBW1602012.1 hypothetical protein [Streptomyces sp. JJ66]
MRIGVRLDARELHAALLDGDRVHGAATAPVSGAAFPHAAADRALRGLIAAAAAPVTSVTWDISGRLAAALTTATSERSTHLGSTRGDDASACGEDQQAAAAVRPVGALRLVPRPPAVPAAGDHPAPLVRALVAGRGSAPGGHDLFGTELAPLDRAAVLRRAETMTRAGLTTVAVTATGATARPDHELEAAAAILDRFPRLRLCLSHETGGLGLLEREATTVINAALLDPAEALISGGEQTTKALPGAPACWFATSDGGRVSGRRLSWLPVLGLAASGAAALTAAARLAGTPDALVLLIAGGALTVGQVREGLPHVEADLPGVEGVRIAAPQPVLSTAPARCGGTALLAARSRHTADVIAVQDEAQARVAEDFLRLTHGQARLLRPDADLAAAGAACTEPGAWLDLLVPVGTGQTLPEVQLQAEQRALDLVAAHGAEPGSARIVRSSATAVGYLLIYRLQIRAVSTPVPGAAP